ncbi:MAG: AbrB/MazE/SpoVT family DNA-binding domain-containing protein [Leptospiraceae bacterium]|nr:AbrB/MazE/SpoVT family DNA-binding domain-containing protein [Leptospiraceae bacterium]
MSTVTISAKYQVVIPKEVREKNNLRPGQEVEIFYYDGRIEIIPLQNIKKIRGIAKGLSTSIDREKDRF